MPRLQHPRQTQAEADAMLARVDAMFDAVFAQTDELLASAKSAGLCRDPRSRTRLDDLPLYAGRAPAPDAPEPQA